MDELRRIGRMLADAESDATELRVRCRQLTGERDALWSKLAVVMTELSAAHCTIAAADALVDAFDAFLTANRARALDEAQRVSVAVAVARLEDALKAFRKAQKGQC